MNTDFDPSLLRAFVAVTEAKGFTHAAQRLNLTQSAISHQIRRLEEQVGRPLLYRTTRSLTLTEDGASFLRDAQQILQMLDALARRFQPSSVSGSVRFGVPENFMGERLPTLLCQFGRAYPAIRLDVNVGPYLDLRTMIHKDELDLAVVLSKQGQSDGHCLLRRTQFVWVAAEIFEPPHGTSLPLALSPAPCINREIGLTALEKTSVDWHIVFTAASQQGLNAAILSGLAVTVMLRSDLEPGMKIVDGHYGLPALPTANFELIWSSGGKTPAAREFGQMIQNMSDHMGGASMFASEDVQTGA